MTKHICQMKSYVVEKIKATILHIIKSYNTFKTNLDVQVDDWSVFSRNDNMILPIQGEIQVNDVDILQHV